MKILAILVQIAVMAGDLMILVALAVAFKASVVLGLILFTFVHCIAKDTGGWFFAWRPSSIRAFRANLSK